MITRKNIIINIVGFMLVVSFNVMFFVVPSEGMDTVIFKDGTAIQGDVTIGTYEVIIKTPDGRIITRDPRDVVSITPGDVETTTRSMPDLSFRLLYYSPSEEPWDQGIGGEVRYRYWFDEHMGVSFMGSISSWDIDTEGGEYIYDNYGDAGQIEGNATFFGLGSAFVFRPFRQDWLNILFSAGMEYVFVNSDINAELAFADAYGGWYYVNEDLDIDDGLVALLDVEVTYNITPNLAFMYEGGYQFDVTKGDVTFLDKKIGENKMEGAFMSFGFGFRF